MDPVHFLSNKGIGPFLNQDWTLRAFNAVAKYSSLSFEYFTELCLQFM